jgi:hypothetical protein
MDGDAVVPLIPVNVPEDARGGRSAHNAEDRRGESLDVGRRATGRSRDADESDMVLAANFAAHDQAHAVAAILVDEAD